MAMLVVKTFLVDTDNVKEAYELTEPANDKVEVIMVGQIRPYDDSTQAAPAQKQQIRLGAGGVPQKPSG